MTASCSCIFIIWYFARLIDNYGWSFTSSIRYNPKTYKYLPGRPMSLLRKSDRRTFSKRFEIQQYFFLTTHWNQFRYHPYTGYSVHLWRTQTPAVPFWPISHTEWALKLAGETEHSDWAVCQLSLLPVLVHSNAHFHNRPGFSFGWSQFFAISLVWTQLKPYRWEGLQLLTMMGLIIDFFLHWKLTVYFSSICLF